MTDETSLWLAALLHDLGKFFENVSPPPADLPSGYRQLARYDHETFSAYFLQKYARGWGIDHQAVEQMVLKHHAATLSGELLVQIADWLASYEREEADEGEPSGRGKRTTALCSILTRLKGCPKPLYHQLRTLSNEREALFPIEQVPTDFQESHNRLWQAFIAEVQKMPQFQPETLQALLHKYFWSAPSERSLSVVPDVSLYSHMVSTAAIAVCLARAKLGETELQTLRNALLDLNQKRNATELSPEHQQVLQQPMAILVKGDLSGVQDFLYLLTSSGAARGLRGRSFYLQLLTETIARWLLRRLQLPLTNLLYAGGGHFYLLAPYAQEERMQQLRQQIAQKLWDAHGGDLSLNLSWVSVSALDFVSEEQGGNGFSTKWSEASLQVQRRKDLRWLDLGAEAMADRLFTPQQAGATAEEMCQVCHGEWTKDTDKLDEGVRKCRRCYQFEELGKLLRDPEYIVQFEVDEQPLPPHPDWQQILRAFGVDVHILGKGFQITPPPNALRALLERVDDTDFLCDDVLELSHREWKIPVAYDFRLLADATPLSSHTSGNVADYDHLARSSEGVRWLGVLRMDVDDLGEVFRTGLGSSATLSRVASLSESLRLFFEVWVPQLCRIQNQTQRYGKGKVYLLYAGGDDMFVVGSWSVLPLIADAIRSEFRQYVGGDHVTLSAGIAVEHEKYPLYRLADDAKHALDEHAKAYVRQDGEDKDAICFLHQAMDWQQFAYIAGWKDRLLQMLVGVGGQKVPRSLLMRLMEISRLYRQNLAVQRRRLRKGEINEQGYRNAVAHDRWRWMLIYHLSRFAQSHQSQEQSLNTLRDALLQKELITNIHVAARWAELLTREEH